MLDQSDKGGITRNNCPVYRVGGTCRVLGGDKRYTVKATMFSRLVVLYDPGASDGIGRRKFLPKMDVIHDVRRG